MITIFQQILSDWTPAPAETTPTKSIDCPDCGSYAKLDIAPSPFTGIWECTNPNCAVSDWCEHTQSHLELDTVTYLRGDGEPDEYKTSTAICDDCGNRVEDK